MVNIDDDNQGDMESVSDICQEGKKQYVCVPAC